MSSTWTCVVCNATNLSQDTCCQTCWSNLNDVQSSATATPSSPHDDTEFAFNPLPTNAIDPTPLSNENHSDHVHDALLPELSDLSLSELLMASLNHGPRTRPPPFDSKSSIDPEIISKLQNKQSLLFHGYLRYSNIADISDADIDIHDKRLMLIPSDIITLCSNFFHLNIEQLCNDIHKARPYAINYHISAVGTLSTEEMADISRGVQQRRLHTQMKQESTITYDDLYELAMILRAQRDCFIAYELMECLIVQKPDSSEYHNGMGLILKRWNCLDAAEMHYKLAIDGELTENIYKWNYGLLLEEGQKYDLALQQFLGASKNVDEKEPDYIFEAAYCYQKLGDYDNATINYLKAIEMDANKSSYWIYYAEYLCEELKQYEESITCFEKAIELENHSNANYLYRFARYLRDFHQNYKLSQMYYQKCLALNEEKKEKQGKSGGIKGVNGSYGYLLFLMKEYETANEYLSLAQVTDPHNAWSFYYYGLLHVSYFKDMVAANQVLQKAISVCNTHHAIHKHLQRIKEVDPQNMWYHEKFEALLNEKFDC